MKSDAAAGQACVVALVATYRRAAELQRLLRSLEASSHLLRAAIIIDNAADEKTRAVAEAAESSRLEAIYVSPGSNLGCGGGVEAAERLAFEKLGGELTHLWILDDDAVVAPETLGALLEAMAAESADLAHPLVTNPAGQIGWFPGLLDREKFRAIQRPQAPQDFIAQCGAAPIPLSWSQGIALLVTRRAVETLGFHRADFWVRGEDLEFSLRITARYKGVYVPAARVAHLPPETVPSGSDEAEYAKHRAMLQNIAYTSLRLPHGRRIAATIPGNWLRFLRTWHWTPRAMFGAATAFWNGAVRARPAGVR